MTKSPPIRLFIFIIGSVLIIPFLFSNSTIDPVLLPRFLALSCLTFVLTLMLSVRTQNRPDFSMTRKVIFSVSLCWLFVSAVSLIKTVSLTDGVFEWLKMVLSVTFFYTATLIMGSNKNSHLVLTKTMTVTGMTLAFMGGCQYYGMAFISVPGNYTVCATMAHKNLFASALFLTSPFALYGIFRFSGCWRIFSLISLALIVFGIVISETRSVWGATILTAIMLLSFFRKQVFSKNRIAVIAVFCVILIALFSIGYLRHSGFGIRHSAAIFSSESLNERLLLWKKTLRMIRENPIMGVGPGQWKIVLPSYGRIERWRESDKDSGECPGEVRFQRPHNDYLWVLSETGIPGFLCYLSFFLILIIYIFRIVRRSHDTDKKVFSIFMLSGITGYMVISFFSFPKERIAHTVFLMLIAAGIVSAYHSCHPPRSESQNSYPVSRAILLAGLIFCMIFGMVRLYADIHTKKAFIAHKAGNWETVICEIDKADSRFYTTDPFSTPLSWYRGVANFSSGNIKEACQDFKSAHKIAPYHIHVLNNMGTCHALSGEYEKAAEFYQSALAISPQFQEAKINLSNLKRKIGEK